MKRPAQSRIKNLEGRVKNKKRNSFFKSLIRFYAIVPVLLICLFAYLLIPIRAEAASGINKQINFQGKLVDNNGLNVADSTYTVVFSLYNTSSGGSATWTETDSVTTANGVFQIPLGAVTAFPGNVDFNSDTWYLGIKVGADAEMTPRVRFSAVPYAFNAAALDGIVATNSATQFTITGGTNALIDLTVNGSLTLGSIIKPTATGALTVQSNGANGLTLDTGGAAALGIGATANQITFGATNNPTYAFNGTGTVTFQGTSFILGNGSAATIQTTSNAGLNLLSAGSGNITLGQNVGTGSVIVQPNAGGQASFFIINQGSGDLLTASAAGSTKFIVSNAGTVTVASGQSYTGVGAVTLSSGGSAGLTLDSASGITALATGDVFQISRAGDPTAANGMIYYDSTAGKFKIVENVSGTPTVKTLCNTTDAGCGAGGSTSLQNAYNTGNTINLSSNNLIFGNSPTGVGTVLINPNAGGQAGFIVNKAFTSGDIFTASASGTTKFLITNGGTAVLGSAVTNADALSQSGLTIKQNGLGNAVLSINQTGSGDIFAASASGATKLKLTNTGALAVLGGLTTGDITTTGGNDLNIRTSAGGTVGGNIVIQPADSTDVGGSASVIIDAGAVVSGIAGTVSVGAGNASDVRIGNVAGTVTILGACSGCGGNLQASYNAGNTINLSDNNLIFGSSPTGVGTVLVNPKAGGQAALIINKTVATGDIVAASSSGTTRFLLTNGGTMVIGSGVTNANALSQSGLTIYQNGLGNSVLNVNQLGSGDIFTASASGVTKFQVTNTGKLVLGDSTNGLTFNPGAGPTFAGTGRPTKQIVLSAEYAGAVLTASGSAAITGNMTSDASPSAVATTANNYENYYMWTATALGADQQYTVAVRVTLPKDFSDWATGNAITVDFNTPFTNSALNSLDVFIYKGGDTTGRAVAFSRSNVSATSKNWAQVAFTKTQLTSVAPTLTASGQVAVFYLTFHSTNTVNYVQVGDITLNYLAAF